jgi:deoxyguanosine kinase
LIKEDYLVGLSEAYADFFHHYSASTMLVVNSAEADFINNDEHYNLLLKQVLSVRPGTRNYFNPAPSLL